MKKYIVLLLLLLTAINYATAQTAIDKGIQTIDKAHAEKYIGTLANDSLNGRKAGSAYANKAALYIAQQLKSIGIKPLSGDFYLQAFDKTITVRYDKQKDTTIVLKLNNVLGVIPGKKTDEYIVVGAHYDHIGARKNGGKDEDNIFNGADDNASGTAGVLQIARAFAQCGETPERSIIFAFWDAEEMGLIGSEYFVKNYKQIEKIKGYINLDMIGRSASKERANSVQYSFSINCPVLVDWVKNAIKTYKLNLDIQYEPMKKKFYNSDHSYFVNNNIPSVAFFTGLHPDYHKVGDEVDKINWDKTVAVSKAAFAVAWYMANNNISTTNK